MRNTMQSEAVRQNAVRRSWRRIAGLLLAVLGTGCSLDGLLNSDELPANVSDPAITLTPEGAHHAYVGALALLRMAFGASRGVVPVSGMLTDELSLVGSTTTTGVGGYLSVDQRSESEARSASRDLYGTLHTIRGQSGQAIGLLARHLPDQPALVGHLYAVQGYAELFLAEVYCSGIPLSTIDFDGDFTYRPGSSTQEVLAHAVALFDTALGLAGDSVRFVNLARIGKARALLGMGEYAQAASAAATIADGYRYEVRYSDVPPTDTTLPAAKNFVQFTPSSSKWNRGFTVPDGEGFNGLNWRTSQDPRVQVEPNFFGPNVTFYYPGQYNSDGTTPIVLASGAEARLVESEAALQAGSPSWLTILNALRTDGTFEVVDSQAVTDTTIDDSVEPPDSTIDTTSWTYDTLWHAGSGGVDGLAPLSDPGTEAERVDLLFRERAFWLFLTGHRQGDLRRLIRQYGRSQGDLYPVGVYPRGGLVYGADVTLPAPASELVNPLYSGCLSRGA